LFPDNATRGARVQCEGLAYTFKRDEENRASFSSMTSERSDTEKSFAGNRLWRGSTGSQKRGTIVWTDQLLATLLLVLAIACYANSLTNGFVYDDEQQILQNPYIKSWHFLPQIFGTTVWSFVGAAGLTNYYRPLMTFSYLLLWQIFGDMPFGFHLLNVVVNGAVVLLVFYAGLALFRDRRVAWVAAALFAVHPVHTEAVNWIAGLPDLEATFFFLLAFWLFSKPGEMDWKRQSLTVLSFVLALLSKEPALMLAPLAIFFEQFVRDDHIATSFASKAKRWAPLCLAAPAYLLLRVALFGGIAPVLQHPKITWPEAFYSSFALIGGYTRYLFHPVPLSAFHTFQQSTSVGDRGTLFGICVVLLCLALLVLWMRKAPAAAFCILWIGFTLAPVLNARWMAANVFTERYLYLPSVGFCWLAAWCGVQLWDARMEPARWLRPVLAAVLVAVCGLCVAQVIPRNRVWSDDLTLYTSTLETNPDAHVIRNNLAAIYYDRGDLVRAGREWELALEGKPDNVVTMNALAMLYTQRGRYSEARTMVQRAIAAKPLWGPVHYNYGLLLQKENEPDKAMAEFKLAVELSPLDATARRCYGEALLGNGRLNEAEVELNRSVELESTLPALHDLAAVYAKMGRTDLEEVTVRRLVSEFPYDSAGHFQLGQLLETAGRKAEALHEYQQGLSTDAGNVAARAAIARLRQ
jgi:Tfp pilus assembly protein PilF